MTPGDTTLDPLEQLGVERDDIIGKIVGHRLQQSDLMQILSTLDESQRDNFLAKLADTLSKTSMLLDVARQIADATSLDELLPRMVRIVSSLVDADRATIFLYDQDTNDLYSRVAQGDNLSEIRFPSHLGIAGSVFTTGDAVLIADAYSDPRFNPEIDRRTGYVTRNIMCAPIMNGQGHTIGVTQVLNKLNGAFEQTDLELLHAVTSQAASAFMNAQLMESIERARREEAQLLEVTTAISTELHLEPLLRKIMDTVTLILNADRSTLFMYDRQANQLWSRVGQGLGATEIRIPADAGIAGSVFSSGETINIPDAYRDNRFNPDVDRKTGYRTESILCMPVINKKGQRMGVTQVLNKRGGPFTSMDEHRLRAFSSQASVAIENAQLFEDMVTMRNYNESILQSMSNGVITVDETGNIAKVNGAALRLWRFSGPDVLEGTRSDAFFADKNAWVQESLDRVRSSGDSDVAMNVELWLRDEDSAYPNERRRQKASVNVSVVPLTNPKNEHLGCMVVIEDITEEKRLRGTMARYMTKEVADKLLEEGEGALGGQAKNASVLFSDIRSFTTISERLGAQETVKMLNEYFTIMVDVILESGGILDKYIGDAIMAVFGAPFSGPRDADNAVKAGIGMLRACGRFNLERVAAGQEQIQMGLGVNTDEVLSGNIGSPKRMDYTVIGDGVNLASRLEGANKPYGTQMLISEFTVNALRDTYQLREIDRITVKGKTQPVGIYEVLDHWLDQDFPNKADVSAVFQQARQHYLQRDWERAKSLFSETLRMRPADTVSQMYVGRCDEMMRVAPPEDWDGTYTMTSK